MDTLVFKHNRQKDKPRLWLVDLDSIDPGSNPGSPTTFLLLMAKLLFFSALYVENRIRKCLKWFSKVLLVFQRVLWIFQKVLYQYRILDCVCFSNVFTPEGAIGIFLLYVW